MSCTCNKGSGLFYYTRKEKIEKPTINGVEQPEEFKDMLDCFNLNKVIRSVEMIDGRRLVLLDDIHERLEKTPQFNHKTAKITGYTKERNTFQSEIYLTVEDSKKFVELTNN